MRGRVREAGDGAWPCEAEAEKGEIGGDEVRGLSWAEGGEESFQMEGSAWHPEAMIFDLPGELPVCTTKI